MELINSQMIEKKFNVERPRILCIVDSPDWIFNRHVSIFEKYLSDNFQFIVGFRGQTYNEADYDLIYPLEFDLVNPEQIINPRKYVTGIRSFVAWADWDILVLTNFLVTHFNSIHVVSKQLFDIFSPYISDLKYVTHGVDTNFFKPENYSSPDPEHLRLGWAGNRNTYVKGFREYIQPLSSIPGVELIDIGFSNHHLSIEEMPSFYKSIDAYVCASSFEGNNNSILEAAAMERAIITTFTGTVPEFLIHNNNALIVDRDIEQFRTAAITLRDNPEMRSRLGKNARNAILSKGWDWENKIKEYREFFIDALEKSYKSLDDRVVTGITDINHYSSILQIQYHLERDLRIGYAYRCIELEAYINQQNEVINQQKEVINQNTYELSNLNSELANLKSLRIYRIYTYLNSIKIISWIIGKINILKKILAK